MKKSLSKIGTMMFLVATLFLCTACHDDERTLAEDVAGQFTGTIQPVGSSATAGSCYITLKELSDNVVRLESLISEKYNLNLDPYNLQLKKSDGGSISIESETNKSINGSYYGGQLNLTFKTKAGTTYYFTGSKN
jgi:hypothetical protein